MQLVSSIFLLKSRQIGVLQWSLLGGILQNLLIVTGLSFLLGGIGRVEQFYHPDVAMLLGGLLLLAVTSLAIPNVSLIVLGDGISGPVVESRAVAIIIIVAYIAWLVYRHKTDRSLFEEVSQKSSKIKRQKNVGQHSETAIQVCTGLLTLVLAKKRIPPQEKTDVSGEHEAKPELTLTTAVITIMFSATILALNSQYATDSIQGLMTEHHLSESFMGTVVLPVLGNDLRPVGYAIKDDMQMSVVMTLERCIQTTLTVVPLIVLIAWGMQVNDMVMIFPAYSVTVLLMSIIVVTYMIQTGKSNW